MDKRVPVWVIVLVAALTVVGGFVAFWFVLIVAAFGCDSGWEGCGDAAGNAMLIYLGIAALAFVGGLVWSIVGTSRAQQIIAVILMPTGLILAIVAAVGYYAMMASRAGA